jgi:penicillin-binding protein 2
LEAGWGGTAQQRLERRYASYAAERGATVNRPPRREEEIFDRVEAEARRAATQTDAIAGEAIAPRSEANPSSNPPAASPADRPEAPPDAAPAPAPAPATAPPTGVGSQ